MRTLSLRTILLLGFVIVMPLVALPAVARRLDDWLYGPPPAEFSPPPLHHELSPAIEPQMAERASPASYDEIAPPATLSRRQPHEGLDALSLSPPPLDPLPAFDRVATSPSASAAGPLAPLADAASARLVQIRQQLESLGAEYIVLDTTDSSKSYRFHCQIRLGEQAPYTWEFEADSADPLAAAEKVLAEVSVWRAAAAKSDAGKKLR